MCHLRTISKNFGIMRSTRSSNVFIYELHIQIANRKHVHRSEFRSHIPKSLFWSLLTLTDP